MLNSKAIAAATLAAALLSACGGGGGGSTPAVPQTPSGTGKGQAQFTFVVPGRTSGAARTRTVSKSPVKTATAATGYSSRGTKSIAISFVPHGGVLPAVNAAPAFATNIQQDYHSNLTDCTAALADGSYTCTVLIPAAVGFNDFQISEWDANNTTPGTTPAAPSGNVLATVNSLTTYPSGVLVEQNQTNVLNLPLSGVVNAAGATLTTTSMVAGTANTTVLGVTALDADGNLITGNRPYVDATGANVTLQVAGTPNCPCAPVGTAPASDFSGLTFNYTSPTQTYTITYTPASGNSLTNVTFVTAATSGAPPAANLHGTTLSFTQSNNGGSVPGAPQASYYTGMNNGANASDIITASDGNVYANEGGATGGWMDRAVPSFPLLNKFQVVNQDTTVPTIAWIAAGADGYIWYVDSANNEVGKFAPSTAPVVTSVSLPAAGLYGSIIAGADGQMYVSNTNGNIYRVNPQNMGITAINTTGAPEGLASGPVIGGHQTLFYADQSPNTVGYIDLSDSSVHHLTGVAFVTNPYRIVAGSDGMIYVGTLNASIFRVDPAGTGSIANTYTTTGIPEDLGIGPDGNVWAGLNNGKLARVTIPKTAGPGVVNEFGSTSNLTCAGQIIGITAALDGAKNNLWSDDTCGNVIELRLP